MATNVVLKNKAGDELAPSTLFEQVADSTAKTLSEWRIEVEKALTEADGVDKEAFEDLQALVASLEGKVEDCITASELAGYATETEVEAKIVAAIASIEAKIPDVAGYVTESDLEDAVNAAIANTEFVTEDQLADAVTDVVSDLTGFIKKEDLEDAVSELTGFVTEATVNELIDAAGHATKTELAEVEAKIPDVSSFVTETELDSVAIELEKKIPDVDDFVTEAEVDAKIAAAAPDLSDYATKADIPDVSELATKVELQEVKDSIPDTSTFALKTDLSEVIDSIPDVSNYVTKDEVPNTSSFVTSATYDPLTSELTLLNSTNSAVSSVTIVGAGGSVLQDASVTSAILDENSAEGGDFIFSIEVVDTANDWSIQTEFEVSGDINTPIEFTGSLEAKADSTTPASGQLTIICAYNDIYESNVYNNSAVTYNFDKYGVLVIDTCSLDTENWRYNISGTFTPTVGYTYGMYLVLEWALSDGTTATSNIDVSKLSDVYTSGTGIYVSDNTINLDIDYLNEYNLTYNTYIAELKEQLREASKYHLPIYFSRSSDSSDWSTVHSMLPSDCIAIRVSNYDGVGDTDQPTVTVTTFGSSEAVFTKTLSEVDTDFTTIDDIGGKAVEITLTGGSSDVLSVYVMLELVNSAYFEEDADEDDLEEGMYVGE